VGKHKAYSITGPDGHKSGSLVLHGHGKRFTLFVPDELCNEREICGIAWIAASTVSLFVHYTDAPYVSKVKGDLLGSLAFCGTALPESMTFQSRDPDANGHLAGIPDGIVASAKNCVIEDAAHEAIFMLYKLGDTACSCHSVRLITPLVAFACAIAVVIGPKWS
jgi:hypothetical protein